MSELGDKIDSQESRLDLCLRWLAGRLIWIADHRYTARIVAGACVVAGVVGLWLWL